MRVLKRLYSRSVNFTANRRGDERLRKEGRANMKPRALAVVLGILAGFSVAVQAQSARLVTQPIDETNLVTLSGSVHPLARMGTDRGAVSDSLSAGRMLLLLNRPPGRDAALQQYLGAVNKRGSAQYHHWLTPEQFGQQFGPVDADIQTATSWLASQGFSIAEVSIGRQFIEFSGTTGALRETFHTEIHAYDLNGKTYYANATDIKIPAALAPLVKGLSPLNSFYAKPDVRILGSATYSPSSNRTTPQWTLPNGSSAFYAVAPEDFATQYDLAPLYKAGITGAGQTIGIINESNIDLSLVQAYQKLFGLSGPTPEVVIDGSDPGEIADVSTEAYLDVEQAGAVAPGANVLLYLANSNGLFTGGAGFSATQLLVDPLYLAALRAVDDNQASVLSVSFGNCEGFLLASGNTLWSELWQQAAAQGQTVLVSSGDSGSAGCDDAPDQWITEYGLAVNGLASTPWDVAVGGTDFYYSDYASGAPSAAALWNQTNDADNGSLKAPLPEQVWDTVYGFNAVGPYVQTSSESIPAGGGGASSCINSAENTSGSGLPFTCGTTGTPALAGYAKPSWQAGKGVLADGVRDLPDVSLYAALGTNLSGYPICAAPGDCTTDSGGNVQVTMVGGTSASTPGMAGVMALVNQKYGRQGQADFTLYPLARQAPTAFHDITLGSNNMTCVQNSPDCTLDTNGDGFYSLQNYSATPGYDLASGLGSIDASALVNNWNSITFQPTTTTLQIDPTSATRGATVKVTITVASASGGGNAPSGSVTLVAEPASLSATPLGVFTLSSGTATGSLTDLPGGTYQVWAEYGGNGVFASSQSAGQTVTIDSTTSTVNLYGFAVPGQILNPAAPCALPPNQDLEEVSTNFGNFGPFPSGSTFGAYTQVAPVAIVNGAWPSNGTGTGNVTFSLNGVPQATVALNSYGYAAWVPPTTFNAGTYAIGATYSGDGSYTSSTATPYTAVVPQVTPSFFATPAANCTTYWGATANCSFSAGDTLRVEVQISQANCHVPTGAITVNVGSLAQNVTLIPGGLTVLSLYPVGTPMMSGEAVFPNLPAGTYPVSATYAGDANSLPTTSAVPTSYYASPSFTVVATAPPAPLLPTITAVTVNPPSINDAIYAFFYVTAIVTGPADSTVPPTGSVDVFDDGFPLALGPLIASGPNSATATTMIEGTQMDIGSTPFLVVYSGDSVYQSSTNLQSYQFTLPTATPDFLLAPQVRQLTVQAGSSGTAGLNLASIGGFSGTVSLSCVPSSSEIACSVSPTTISVNGQAPGATTLTVTASSQAASLRPSEPLTVPWPVSAGAFTFCLFFVRRKRTSRLWRAMLPLFLALACISTIACGATAGTGTGGGGGGGTKPPPAVATYNVVVTGTANGVVHNAAITVVVQ